MCREAAVSELAAWKPDIQQVQMWVCDLVISRKVFDNAKFKMYNAKLVVTVGNVIEDKSYYFAVRIVRLCKHLRTARKEFVLSNQLLRSGTSIGANIAEAQRAQSRADFVAKLSISHKEVYETKYWLRLLHETGYLTDIQARSILSDCTELEKILTAILNSTKK